MKALEQPVTREQVVGLTTMFFNSGTLAASVLAAWSLTSALQITESFAVDSGLFANWLVWVGMAILIHGLGRHVEQELKASRWPGLLIVSRRVRRVPPKNASAAAA